jgi:hypothetical protein
MLESRLKFRVSHSYFKNTKLQLNILLLFKIKNAKKIVRFFRVILERALVKERDGFEELIPTN